ncbi:uncharacterized protein LOC102809489 [Saccoglossus kowalevskii]|uniref:RING-type E3 ubiquitin transferase n=1 Tax=Saccoglossus kowalevskii TaxID=10224 RepID=A0ABM0MF34_SACKO|nr:PREDICTED: uncharacterized protein LOC102809489 [Saccoglossus kowalevskii]
MEGDVEHDEVGERSIVVPNLTDDMTELGLREHFQNPEIGGGEVEAVHFSEDHSAAKVTFVDLEVAQRICKTEAHYVQPYLNEEVDDPPPPPPPEEQYEDYSPPPPPPPHEEEQIEGHSQYGQDETQQPMSPTRTPENFKEEKPLTPTYTDQSQMLIDQAIRQSKLSLQQNRTSPQQSPSRQGYDSQPSLSRQGDNTLPSTPRTSHPRTPQQESIHRSREIERTPAHTPAPSRIVTPPKSTTSSVLLPRTPLLQEQPIPYNVQPDVISMNNQPSKSVQSLQAQRASYASLPKSAASRPPTVTTQPQPQENASKATLHASNPVPSPIHPQTPHSQKNTSHTTLLESKPIPSPTRSQSPHSQKTTTPDTKQEHASQKSTPRSVSKQSIHSVKDETTSAKSGRSSRHSSIFLDSRPTTTASQQVFVDVEGTLSPRLSSVLDNKEDEILYKSGIKVQKSNDGVLRVSGTMSQLRRAEELVKRSLVGKRTSDGDTLDDDTISGSTISSGPTIPPTPPTPGYGNLLLQSYALHNVIYQQSSHGNTLKMDETLRDYIDRCMKDSVEEIEAKYDVQVVFKGNTHVSFLDEQNTWDTQNVMRAIASFKKLYRDIKAKHSIDVLKLPEDMTDRGFVFSKQDCEKKYPSVMVNKGKPGYATFHGISKNETRDARQFFAARWGTHIKAFDEHNKPVPRKAPVAKVATEHTSPPPPELEDPIHELREETLRGKIMHSGDDNFRRSYILGSREIQIRIYDGNILDETVDAIVCPVNEQMKPSCDIAVAIVKEAGPDVRKEIDAYSKRHGQLRTSHVTATSAGKLPTTLILHAVCPRWSEANPEWSSNFLSDTYRNILETTHKYAAISIAIPPLGTGLLGFPRQLGGEIACTAVVSFLKRNPKTSVRDIRLVSDDAELANKFTNIFNKQFALGVHSYKGVHPVMRAEIDKQIEQLSRRSTDGDRKRIRLQSKNIDIDSQERKDMLDNYRAGGSKLPSSDKSTKGDKSANAAADDGEKEKDKGENKGSKAPGEADGGDKESKSDRDKSGRPKGHSWKKTEDVDKSKEKEKDDGKTCKGCKKPFQDPIELPTCKHKLCRECMVKVRGELKCLICEKEYKPTQGKQPKGKMTSSIDKTIHIPEYDKFTTTVIKYTFNEGVQAEGHPHPGMKYKGELFTAYLPNNKEGSQLLILLKKAFDKGLLFGIAPREILDTIDWKDIDHKTSVTGGPEM